MLAAGGDGGNLNYGAVAGGGWTGSGHNVWGKLLPGEDFALVFVSNEDTPMDIACTFESCFKALGVDNGAASTYTVRDLWLHADVGELSAKTDFAFTAKQVPIHGGVQAFRFTKTKWVGAKTRG